jgi:hypothetical protein
MLEKLPADGPHSGLGSSQFKVPAGDFEKYGFPYFKADRFGTAPSSSQSFTSTQLVKAILFGP